MSVIRYMCTGNCKTMVTVEQFRKGHDTCGTENCESYGEQLERGEYCPSCNTHFDDGEDHICF